MEAATIDELLAILRAHQDPDAAWDATLALCQRAQPSELWAQLPPPSFGRDIQRAIDWLDREIPGLKGRQGLYLGLDTLNMRNGEGQNVELVGSDRCDPSQSQVDWIYEGLDYGANHLILGLVEMHQAYSHPDWKTRHPGDRTSPSRVADYMIFLSYSGLVLGHALARMRHEGPLLAAWGFHDGDMFALGRRTPSGFEWLAT